MSELARPRRAPVSAAAPAARVDWLAWCAVAALTLLVTATSAVQSLRRYDELRSGWSWDLAYYNQWFRALVRGEGEITVRPVAAYAQEGPSIWKMNYLAPARLAIAPIYAGFPGPRTLIVVQNLVFWWIVPAAFGWLRAEGRSRGAALAATALVPTLPLFWPLVWNDFRELQLAGPFVLWAARGVRCRSLGWAALGTAGMLACRQEFALIVASFALLRPRKPEPLETTLRWRRALVLVGLFWVVFLFFGYLKFAVGGGVPNDYMDQFLGPKAPFATTLVVALETLIVGTGGWAVLMAFAPREAVLVLPWVASVCGGRWAMRILETEGWHEVRYTMPIAVLTLAAGLLGYARLAERPSTIGGARRAGPIAVGPAVLWAAVAAFNLFGLWSVVERLDRRPPRFGPVEARAIWDWIDRVGPDDAVLVDHRIAAPLSSRAALYGYVLDSNLPRGFPRLGPEFRWLFIGNDCRFPGLLSMEGFEVVYRGPHLTIERRRSAGPGERPKD